MTSLDERFTHRRMTVIVGAIVGLLCLVASSAPAQSRLVIREPVLASPQQGARSGQGTGDSVPLTLEDAVRRGLRENLSVLLQEAAVTSAEGNRWVKLKGLLPELSGRLAATRQRINLAAFGFSVPGVPPIVGPFNVYDARVSVSQALVDLHALHDARAGAAMLNAEQHTLQDARALVALAVRNLYLQAVASDSRLRAARAQAETARALLTQATDLKNAGVVAGIDVLRAQVQLRTQEQRVIAAENEFEKDKLQIARAIGLSLGQALVLTDTIPYAPVELMPLAAAVERALTAREDYQAADERLKAAESAKKAAHGDLLPSLQVNADYGSLGRTWDTAHSTFAVVTQVRVPLFDAEKVRGRVLEADGLVQRRRAEVSDFRASVEYEVRAAFLDLRFAEEHLRVADETVKLANEELAQSRDRFAAGVASNIEVVQAQEAVASATDSYISGLYGFNLAKASLAHAIGASADSPDVSGGGSNDN